MMDFDALLRDVLALLQRQERVAYRALKVRLQLDDDLLEAVRDELIYAKKLALDEDNRVLVFIGDAASASPLTCAQPTPAPVTPPAPEQSQEPLSYTPRHLAEKILTSRSALEGEHKQVTVLFCDLANSTAIATEIGAEATHGLLSRFFELAMDEVHRYEGTVNQLLGDGFMALFGAPIAHEDHARRAVLAALNLQQTLRNYHAELGGPHGVDLAFRMGLNTGMVVVGSVGNDLRLDYTAIGDATNLAARLEQIAEPGTILVSETTSRLVQGDVRLEALAPVQVKGKTDPVALYKVIGTLPRRSPIVSRSERTLSQFVGRERELAVLDELLKYVGSGQGQVVGIVADAGQGKSRLLYEFRQRVAGKSVTYLEGRCLSYGRTTPYHPIIDIVRHHCGITETDSPATLIANVRLAVQEVGMDAEECSPDVLEPLLLDLKRLEFLYERPGGEASVYVFKHALTQDVAYESLLTTRRQALHAVAGQALETLYAGWLTERAEELAHHFTRGAVGAKAFVYLAKSGDKARQAYANQEAIAFYTQAIEVSEPMALALDATQLLPVYEGRGIIWRQLAKYDEAIADFQMMRQLARASDNRQKEGESLWLLGRAHYGKGAEDQTPFMEQYAQEGLRLAQHTGDQHILAQSLTSLGLLHTTQGNVQEAIRNLEEAVQISRREGDNSSLSPGLTFLCQQVYFQGRFQAVRPLAEEGASVSRDLFESSNELFCLGFLCQSHWSLGDYGKAFTVADEMSTKSQVREHLFYLSRIKNTLGWFHRELGDVSRAVAYNRESVELGRTVSLPNAEISALVNLGLDYFALEQYARSQSYLESTLERVQREGFGTHRWRWTIRLLVGLAELCYTTGDYDQALRYVEEGLKEAQRTSSQKYIALGWLLRGKIAAKLGDLDAAGTQLQRAFTLADQLQSPSLIYPIAYDLGQWHERSGNERNAAEVYGKATATIEQMATVVEDEALRSTFLQSALVQTIHESVRRVGG